MRKKADIENVITIHGDTIWRVCVLYFKSHSDAQDVFQETILKYATCKKSFNDEEHIKAWLIRVATNACKDMLKAAHRKNISLEDQDVELTAPQSSHTFTDTELWEILEAIRELGDPPRTAIYLALYEGYEAKEIAKILKVPTNTVYSWIARGKQQLKEVLR